MKEENTAPVLKDRVAICIPSGDMVHIDFFMHLYALIEHSRSKNIEISVINEKGSHIDISRYNLVKAAQQVKADYLLFLDSDMTFPAETLERLLSHRKLVIGASYVRRRPPHSFVHTDLDGGCNYFRYGLAALAEGGTGIREVKRIPAGVMLVDMNVFKKLPAPWFDSMWNPANEQRISEDNAFCDLARRNNTKIWLDEYLTGFIGHLGQATYQPEPCLDGVKFADIELNADLPEPMPEDEAA